MEHPTDAKKALMLYGIEILCEAIFFRPCRSDHTENPVGGDLGKLAEKPRFIRRLGLINIDLHEEAPFERGRVGGFFVFLKAEWTLQYRYVIRP